MKLVKRLENRCCGFDGIHLAVLASYFSANFIQATCNACSNFRALPTNHLEYRLKIVENKLKALTDQRNTMLRKESESIVREARIIGATLVKCGLWPLQHEKFDIVIIDEASQATITLALLAMIKARKRVLVGDHYQLPPVLKSDQIQNYA